MLEHLPALRHVAETGEAGRGLNLVSRLAKRWGANRPAGGKLLWFEPALPTAGGCDIESRAVLDDTGRMAWVSALPGTSQRSRRMNCSTAFANPSSSFDVVTRRAARWTCESALPMAILRPEWANMSTSLGMSPMVAMSRAGMR